jgi:ribose transport system ATP-binding protein
VPLLQARNLCNSYNAVPVLQSVDFDLEAGEVHALVGENGAGKSTLCRILCGLTPADSGTMQFDSNPYAPHSRRHAESTGVRMVMQELNLLPTLSVAENIFMDSMPHRLGFINYKRLHTDAARAIATVGLHNISPDQPLHTLGIGQRQLVEIASALSRQCRVLVLDEPTAALTSREIDLLFTQIRRLQSTGVGIIYVSHRMDEIRSITNRITILRDGQRIETHNTSAVSHDQIIREMVGRDLSPSTSLEGSAPAEPRLSPSPTDSGERVGERGEVRHPSNTARTEARPPKTQAVHQRPVALNVRNLNAGPRVQNISFDLHHGEILGLAGLMGSGRTETLRALFAADPSTSGQIFLRDSKTPARIRSPRDAVRHGIALLTEDRKSQGLLLPLPISTNTTLSRLGAVSRLNFINPTRESTTTQNQIHSLSIRCRSGRQPVAHLSGGNQQKVVLAKWLLRDCDILLLDEPTRGIDVGAKFEIYQLLRNLADQGKAILVVSSDLLELLAISDRIAIMSNGRLVETFDRPDCTQERIMAAALSGYSQQKVPA